MDASTQDMVMVRPKTGTLPDGRITAGEGSIRGFCREPGQYQTDSSETPSGKPVDFIYIGRECSMNLLRKTFAPPNLTALILTFLLCLSAAGPTTAQTCGDFDYSGVVDITDLSVFIDHLLLSQTPLSEPQLGEMDGVPGITYNDLISMWDNQVGSKAPLDCSLTPDTSFQFSDDTVKFRGSTGIPLGLMLPYPHVVEVWLKAVDAYYGVSLPLSYYSDTPSYFTLDSVVGNAGARIDTVNQLVFLYSWPPELHPAGEHLLARLHFTIGGAIDLTPPIDIVFDTTGYPPSHTTVLSRAGVSDRAIDGFVPSFMVDTTSISCCRARTGNIDCDGYDIVDIADVQVLVDHLFLTLAPLCCEAEANINYPGSGYGETDDIVDVTDLSILIDNQFLTLAPLPVCP